MANYWIKKVKKSDEDTITEVKYSHDLDNTPMWKKSKSAVISNIDGAEKDIKTAYKSNGEWKEGDSVHTVEGQWIRTDGNEIDGDNLGNIPEY